jgi:hypothetical protein
MSLWLSLPASLKPASQQASKQAFRIPLSKSSYLESYFSNIQPVRNNPYRNLDLLGRNFDQRD